MKKALFISVICCFSYFCIAKSQETAHSIIEKALKKKDFQIDFISKTFAPQSTTPESEFSASVIVCDKMYYIKTSDVHVICDSKTIWKHLLLESEVQVIKADSEINFWNVLYNCNKYYNIKSMHKIMDREKSYYVIDMMACDKENEFPLLVLKINIETLLLQEVKLYEVDRTVHIFIIVRFQGIKKLPKVFFTFPTKDHPTVEVVDLR